MIICHSQFCFSETESTMAVTLLYSIFSLSILPTFLLIDCESLFLWTFLITCFFSSKTNNKNTLGFYFTRDMSCSKHPVWQCWYYFGTIPANFLVKEREYLKYFFSLIPFSFLSSSLFSFSPFLFHLFLSVLPPSSPFSSTSGIYVSLQNKIFFNLNPSFHVTNKIALI